MGIWSGCEVIQCDSMIEVAMKMLCVAGLGPENYEARARQEKLVITAIKEDGSCTVAIERPVTAEMLGGNWMKDAVYPPGRHIPHVSRHTPAEYEEFFGAWRAAVSKHAVIEAKFCELMEFCQSYVLVTDRVCESRPVFGSAYHLFFLLLMQNGCALPPDFKESVMLSSLSDDAWAKNPSAYARRVLIRKLCELVAAYDERGGTAVEYRIESFAESMARIAPVRLDPATIGLDKEACSAFEHATEKREAQFVAETFDSRVHRSTFRRGPPPKIYARMVQKRLSVNNGDLQRISASRNGGQPVPQIDLGFDDDKQEDPQTHHPGRVSRDVKRSVRANVGAEDFDVEQCCAKCGKWDFGAGSDVSLKRCARCLTIYYCSPACQKEHWPQHKKHCKRLKAQRDAAKGLTGAMAAARIS